MYNNMIKVDKKDKKILYQLNINSRQPISKIGKKVGLPKNVVIYRIKRLEEKGIIKNYYTLINPFKLGYNIFRMYFSFQYTTPETKKEIVKHFLKNKSVGIVHTTEGGYDLVIYIYVKNLDEFYTFWTETLNKYRDYFSKQILSIYFKEHIYNTSFLLEEMSVAKKIDILTDKTKAKIDKLDFQILKLIAPNARMPTSEIGKKIKSPPTTIANRIKKLIELGVIEGFKTNIDYTKLGYTWYKVDIELKEYNRLQQIVNYLERNPQFAGIDVTIGHVDLEIQFYLKDINHLHEIMEDLSTKFKNAIKSYKHITVIKTHKYEYMPKS